MKSKKYVWVEKKTNKITYPQLLPNDMMNEILNQLKTYDQLLLCDISKNIKCHKNVKILVDNIKYKKIAIDKNTFIIKNKKLYTNILITDGKIIRKLAFYEIETPVVDGIRSIPLAVACHGYDLVLLTSEGLYVKRIIREMYQPLYLSDYIKINVNEQITSFYLNAIDEIYIATPNYIIIYGILQNTRRIINIVNCLGFLEYNDSWYLWTPNGLYGYNHFNGIITKINIDGINDILDVTSDGYNRMYVLTSTGLYKNIPTGKGGLISLKDCTFGKMDMLGVKHISGHYVLTTNGDLRTKDIIYHNISYMESNGDSFIAIVNDDYYASGPLYYLENKFEKIL